jgi:hypothetical protein
MEESLYYINTYQIAPGLFALAFEFKQIVFFVHMTGAAIDALDASAYLITEDTDIHVLKKMLVSDGGREEWARAQAEPWY